MSIEKKTLKPIRTPEEAKAVPHLSEEEREFAAEALATGKIPETTPYFILGNDPELQAMWRMTELSMNVLLAPDHVAVPFGCMSLIALVASKHSGSEYQLGCFTSHTAAALTGWGKGNDVTAKMAMLDFPDSKIWNDEERLIIRFTKAILDKEMNDDLMSEALEMWGEKKTLRYLSWIAYVSAWNMVANCFHIPFIPSTDPVIVNFTPEMQAKMNYDYVKEGYMALWEHVKGNHFE